MKVTLTIEEFEALARIAIDKLCEGFERCDSDQASRDMKLSYERVAAQKIARRVLALDAMRYSLQRNRATGTAKQRLGLLRLT